MNRVEGELRAGLAALGLDLTDTQVGQLLQFAELLQKWTRVYNLTALRRPEEVLTHHVLDSAAVVGPLCRVVSGKQVRLLDVGSGGGLPVTPLEGKCRRRFGVSFPPQAAARPP